MFGSRRVAHVWAIPSKFRKATHWTAGCPYASLGLPADRLLFQDGQGFPGLMRHSDPKDDFQLPAPGRVVAEVLHHGRFRVHRISLPPGCLPCLQFVVIDGPIAETPASTARVHPVLEHDMGSSGSSLVAVPCRGFRGGGSLRFTNLAPVPNHRAGKGLCRCVRVPPTGCPFQFPRNALCKGWYP